MHANNYEKNVAFTTRNSVLSTRSFPSVSNMLNAIRNPDLGSANKIIKLIYYFHSIPTKHK